MPNRILREGILTSDRVNSLKKWGAEVFYRRLISKADDFGRYDGRIPVLRGEMYSLKPNVSDADVSSWLQECEAVGLVSRYETDGKQCVVIHKFDQKVRAKKSKWPDPPPDVGTCAQMRADDSLVGVGGADGDGSKPNGFCGDAGRPRAPAGDPIRWCTTADGGWVGITDPDRQKWADAFPACDIERQLRAMDAWLQANPAKAKKSNWRRFIVNWLKKEQDRGGDTPSNRPDTPRSRVAAKPGKYANVGKPTVTDTL